MRFFIKNTSDLTFFSHKDPVSICWDWLKYAATELRDNLARAINSGRRDF